MVVKSLVTLGHGADIAKTSLNAYSLVIFQDKTVVIKVLFLKWQTRLFYQEIKKILTI